MLEGKERDEELVNPKLREGPGTGGPTGVQGLSFGSHP